MQYKTMSNELHVNTHHQRSNSISSAYSQSGEQYYVPSIPDPSLDPPQKITNTSTFVHKLYNMVLDTYYQHLIAWAYTGSSFIVCNIMEFSRDVLPKHFKHNNFSSFVRQLNMYGFHKVNKSPRGHRTLAENQIWEFSHPKFLKNRPELLDDIKRKSMESELLKKDDLKSDIAVLKSTQSEMINQIQCLYDNIAEVIKELNETKKAQVKQLETMNQLLNYITKQNGGQLPPELNNDLNRYQLSLKETQQEKPPSIFVTSHDSHHHNRFEPIHNDRLSINSPFHLPSSPSPSMLLSDDELDNSSLLYSPHSPHTPNHHISFSHVLSSPNQHSKHPYVSSSSQPCNPLSHN